MERLTEFEREVLANLPVEPTGLSLAELSEGLLNDRSPGARGKVRRALEHIAQALGGLYVCTGDDDLGGFGVKMFGLPQAQMSSVREFLKEHAIAHV